MIYGEPLDDSMVELGGFGGNKWVREKWSLLIVLACWPCHQTIGNTGLRKQKGKTNQILANTTQTLNVYNTMCVYVRFPLCGHMRKCVLVFVCVRVLEWETTVVCCHSSVITTPTCIHSKNRSRKIIFTFLKLKRFYCMCICVRA